MAHNITERDGMFTVRQAAWHGLGTVLPAYPTREEAQKLAHPWEPVSEPVYQRVPTIKPHVHLPSCDELCDVESDLGETYEPLTDAVLNVRSDNGYPLGVVSDTFATVTNGEMYDIAEVIEGQDKGSVRYETGGSLKGGRKVWLLLRLTEPIHVNGDPNGAVIPYYALQNAHDGSGSFRGQATMTRIVCDNTAKAADLDAQARGTEFVFSHTKNIKDRIEEAKKALAGWRSSVQAFQDQSAYLLSLGIDVEQRELFLARFIPEPIGKVVSDRVMANIETARDAVRAILKSKTCEGIDGTAYGLVQAGIEFLQHERKAHSQESRFQRAYLDRNKITAHVVDLAEKIAVNA